MTPSILKKNVDRLTLMVIIKVRLIELENKTHVEYS